MIVHDICNWSKKISFENTLQNKNMYKYIWWQLFSVPHNCFWIYYHTQCKFEYQLYMYLFVIFAIYLESSFLIARDVKMSISIWHVLDHTAHLCACEKVDFELVFVIKITFYFFYEILHSITQNSMFSIFIISNIYTKNLKLF